MQFLRSLLQPPSHSTKVSHLYGIDLLRGLSALAILVWHYQHFYLTKPMYESPAVDRTAQPFYSYLSAFYDHGFWAVQIFWIISGLVFAFVYAGREVSAKDFTIRRFARLYPLHLVTLLAVAALQIISLRLTGNIQIAGINDLYHFVLQVFFISDWTLQKGPSFNIPAWSVSIEIGIYILFFFVAKRIFSKGILYPLALTALCFYVVSIGTRLWFFALCGMFFFIGVTIYYLLPLFRKRLSTSLAVSTVSIFFFAYLWQRNKVEPLEFHDMEVFLFAPIVMLIGWLDLSGKVENILRKLKWIGDTTYSIYLWHFPIQILLMTILSYYQMDRSVLNSPFVLVAWILGMLAVGRMSYLYIERPAQLWILARAQKKKAVPERIAEAVS
jgi:peptidoglycan/LPS O-acetylase OafA/YrhL